MSPRSIRSTARLAGLALALSVAGCSDYTLHVESNTKWTGSIVTPAGVQTSYEGTGGRTFDVGSGKTCWAFQKVGAFGEVRAYAQKPSFFLVGPANKIGDYTATADMGIATGCTKP